MGQKAERVELKKAKGGCPEALILNGVPYCASVSNPQGDRGPVRLRQDGNDFVRDYCLGCSSRSCYFRAFGAQSS